MQNKKLLWFRIISGYCIFFGLWLLVSVVIALWRPGEWSFFYRLFWFYPGLVIFLSIGFIIGGSGLAFSKIWGRNITVIMLWTYILFCLLWIPSILITPGKIPTIMAHPYQSFKIYIYILPSIFVIWQLRWTNFTRLLVVQNRIPIENIDIAKGKFRKGIKYGLVTLVFLLIVSLIYLAYDRSLMPPKPTWVSPPYIPSETWEQSAARFLKTRKQPNALVHYLSAFSAVTIPENLDNTIMTIIDKGWVEPYPKVKETLDLNQKAIKEIRLGAQMEQCALPPSPYILSAPIPNWRVGRKLERLMVVSGRKLEQEGSYSQAAQYYLEGMQFGKDLEQKDQTLISYLSGIAFISIPLSPLSELITADKLTDKDLTRIISQCNRIEKELPPLKGAIEVEYRTVYQFLLSWLSPIDWALLSPITFLNKGRIFRAYADYHQEVLGTITTKSYSAFQQTDWERKMPKYWFMMIPNYRVALTRCNVTLCRLRLAQVDSAIRLYHRDKNQWPKSIDELKPNYLTEIPLDPFINQPFHLTIDSTGMFAYSVGPDFKDDSAKLIYGESTTNHNLGDIR
jgi:hypothetical protein